MILEVLDFLFGHMPCTFFQIFFESLPLLLSSDLTKSHLAFRIFERQSLRSVLAIFQSFSFLFRLAFFRAKSLSLISSKCSFVIQGSLYFLIEKFLVGYS